MGNIFTKTKDRLTQIKLLFFAVLMMGFNQVHAALPTPANPSQAPAAGDYIGLWKGYAYDIGIVVGLIIGMIAFIVVAKNMIGIYGEIGDGRKTWSDMGAHGAAGVLLLVFVIYLLVQASTVIF